MKMSGRGEEKTGWTRKKEEFDNWKIVGKIRV